MNSSHEEFWRTSRRDLSQKFQLVWIRGSSRRDPATRSWSKIGQFTRCDLSPRLDAGTRKLVCNDLQNGEKQEKSSAAYHAKWVNTFFFEILWAKIKIIYWLICITRKNRKSQLIEAGCYGFMRIIYLRRKKTVSHRKHCSNKQNEETVIRQRSSPNNNGLGTSCERLWTSMIFLAASSWLRAYLVT